MDARRRHSRADEGRSRLDSRRRRRDPRAARARPGREEEGRRRPLARDHGARAQRRDEDLGHDDVRHRRNAGRAHRASRARARSAGADGRLHGVHLLAAPAGEHADDVAHAEDRRGRVSAHRRDRAHRARQRAESPGELGDDGHEDRPDRAALRLQRLRLAHDRGERRLGGEHHAPHDDRRDRAPDPRRRLHGRAAPAGLLDPAVPNRPAPPRDARVDHARRHRLRLAPLRAAGTADPRRRSHSERRAPRGSLRRRRRRARDHRRDPRRRGGGRHRRDVLRSRSGEQGQGFDRDAARRRRAHSRGSAGACSRSTSTIVAERPRIVVAPRADARAARAGARRRRRRT